MVKFNDAMLDAPVNYVKTNGTRLHACSAEPANYAGIAAVELAAANVTITGPSDGDTSGRKCTCPQTVATPGANGTVTHWALSNGSDTLVLAGAYSSSFAVTNGVQVTLPAFDPYEALDPVSE